jgi:hypothetical protein
MAGDTISQSSPFSGAIIIAIATHKCQLSTQSRDDIGRAAICDAIQPVG